MRKIRNIEVTKLGAKAVLGVEDANTETHISVKKGGEIHASQEGNPVGLMLGCAALFHDLTKRGFSVHELLGIVELLEIVIYDEEHREENIDICMKVLEDAVQEQIAEAVEEWGEA